MSFKKNFSNIFQTLLFPIFSKSGTFIELEKFKLFFCNIFIERWFYFVAELSLINNETIKSFVKDCISSCPIENMICPASSSGKYHPFFDKKYGGCSRHIKAVVKILNVFKDAYPDLDWDCIFAAGIIHDLAKYELGSEHTDRNHPSKMMNTILSSQSLPADIKKYIALLVVNHMGRFYSSKNVDDFGAKLLHLADMLASRSWYGKKYLFSIEDI